ncbi:MAG: transcription-repair coupling factor [Burkholderiaceae bacterium]
MSSDATPQLSLSLPVLAPGERHTVPRPPGSGDALLIARAAAQAKAAGQLLVVMCADALDAQRLIDEVPWFDTTLAARPFPDWETLPYDVLSPHQDLVSERLETLYRLMTRGKGQESIDLLIVPATTAAQRIAPPAFIAAHTFFFRQKERIDLDALRNQLVVAGYQHVSQVVAPGEFSTRGGLVDLFPMGARLPFRLDLMDDEIETIRAFDPDTQRSLYPVPEIRLLPGREFPLDETARVEFRGRWRESFEGDPSRIALYKDIANGVAGAGIEYYLPLFFDATATLFDYLPANSHLLLHGAIEPALQRFWNETSERYRFLSRDLDRPALPPGKLYLDAEQFYLACKPHARLVLGEGEAAGFALLPPLAVERKAEDPIARLRALVDRSRVTGGRVLLAADSAGRRETIGQLLREYDVPFADSADFDGFVAADAALSLGVAPLHAGFALSDARLSIVTETELYAASPRRQRQKNRERTSNVEAMVRDLSELRVGDPVVHVEHGIGRYQGLETMDLGHGPAEFLRLDYANSAKLFVPVAQLHQISRYSGADPEAAPLHHLGGGDWEKAKKKAAKHVRDTAAELLNLYALRAARKGHAFDYQQHDYEAFAEGFGFEETADQQAAIDAVLRDMKSGAPMDRLVCGDVGFGKTEVALRGAFAAVMDGKQVAVLCPTTLLAEQHAETFRDRFADWPVNIVELSRFRSAKEVSAALAGIAAGTIDVVVGTHKLLGNEIKFDRLGLVIIDEEHRFGVRQKEKLKSLRAEVDVLTLTATPIPRTLAMSLEGIRDFSVIATAPQRRLAIKTFVRRESDSLMREAVLRELKRGGQVYFLHNEVETIENRRARLAELLPEARIEIAHGQMGERELERVMRDFYQQRFNVLLCTTIIETGIDVPTANTIIMHRADKFGLAQLHQLRGRVGRSHHQAYAYLMVPDEGALTKNAAKRLEAIQNLEELGSGFYLAMHDLEIRGAGEVLGENQSGDMLEIGFDLYTQMLNAAVRAMKSGKEPDLMAPLSAVTEINLHTPALLPPDYVNDVHQRLSFYKKLASTEVEDDLIVLQEELVDRYGKLPDQGRALMETHKLRLAAEKLGIKKIDASDEGIVIGFVPQPPFEPMKLISLMQKERTMRMAGPDRLRIDVKTSNLDARLAHLRGVFKALS